MDVVQKLNIIGEGQDSEVYLLESNKVLKLFRNAKDNKTALHEIEVLKAIKKAGISVPDVYEYVLIEGRPGFTMSRINGNSIIVIIKEKPYLMLRMSKAFGKFHSEIQKIDAPVEIPLLKERLSECIKNAECLPNEIIEYTLKTLRELPNGNSICHGDYNPSNVIIDDNSAAFIDWGGVSRGDPAADVAHTLLILKNGQFPPNTPYALKIVFRIGRKAFADIYFHTYQRYNQLDLSVLSKWEMIRAVGRLTYGGSVERPALLKFINKHYKNRNKNKIILF